MYLSAMRQEDVHIENWDWNNLEKHYPAFFKLYVENTQGHELDKTISVEYIQKKAEQLPALFENKQIIFFAATVQNQLVGFLWAYPRTFIETPRICINAIIVDEKFRGNKIGEQLMGHLESLASSMGISEIDVATAAFKQNTIDWYQRLGYLPERVQLFKKI
jgi:ribosomal protein S18 acetylase RimI-like enzyme